MQFQRRYHSRNDRVNDGRGLTQRTVETRAHKCLRPAHNAVRMDNLGANARDRAAVREFDRASPDRRLGPAPNAAAHACTDSPAGQTARCCGGYDRADQGGGRGKDRRGFSNHGADGCARGGGTRCYEIQDLRLNRHIKRGGGLVRDQQFRLA